MRQELLDQLSLLSKEEQEILAGNGQVNKALYSSRSDFKMEKDVLLSQQLICVRNHPRFLDFPLHDHDFIEIMYVCSGSITHVIDSHYIELKAGQLLLLNQHSRHEIKKAGEHDIAINLIIHPAFFDQIYPLVGYDNPVVHFLINMLRQDEHQGEFLLFQVEDVPEIQNLMENIISSLLKSKSSVHENQVSMALLLIYLIENINMTLHGRSKAYEDVLVEGVLDYISSHYENASLEEICAILHQPNYRLSKLIKAKSGHTFKELLQSRRFYQALSLLEETDLSISDIIHSIGYENNSYFFHQFKKKYGCTPAQYRLNKAAKKSSSK
jgi:AraC-like DNA-binding protein/mannose-6-phosphate isomerase-like protein (cupin superfamily)